MSTWGGRGSWCWRAGLGSFSVLLHFPPLNSSPRSPNTQTHRTVLSATFFCFVFFVLRESTPCHRHSSIMGALLLPASLSHWPALAGISLTLVFISLIRRLLAWHRLRQFKGPFWAAFSRWWMIRKVGGGRTHLDLREVNEKYGM